VICEPCKAAARIERQDTGERRLEAPSLLSPLTGCHNRQLP
jgi:hypothetical protein